MRDVQLSDDQKASLEKRAVSGQIKGRSINATVRRNLRALAQEEGRQLAQRAEPLHLAGCMLYWAKGAKNRNQLRFTNSDSEMTAFFVKFLRAYFNVADEQIKITCNLFADHLARQREIEQVWLDVLRLPRSSLCTSTVNVYSKYSKKKRQNKLPYGRAAS